MKRVIAVLAASTCLGSAAFADDDRIVVGFATAETGFMQAYDKPAQDAAMIRIDEINEAGGLLGKQIEVVNADTKTDRAEGAKAGLSVIDAGADMVVVSCDYDFGAPAALTAESCRPDLVLPLRRIDQGGHSGRRAEFVLGLGSGAGAGRHDGAMGL